MAKIQYLTDIQLTNLRWRISGTVLRGPTPVVEPTGFTKSATEVPRIDVFLEMSQRRKP